jgi:hypothetical protein
MRGAAGLMGALGIAAGISACTAPPESIAQSDVSPISYNSLNCFDLADELEQIDAALTQASRQQEQAQGNDASGGVFDRGPGVDPERHGRCASTRQPRRTAASDPTCDGPNAVPLDVRRGAPHVVAKQGLTTAVSHAPVHIDHANGDKRQERRVRLVGCPLTRPS